MTHLAAHAGINHVTAFHILKDILRIYKIASPLISGAKVHHNEVFSGNICPNDGDRVSKMLDCNSILPRLIASDDTIAFSHRESFRS
jgi:hypothetical protein